MSDEQAETPKDFDQEGSTRHKCTVCGQFEPYHDYDCFRAPKRERPTTLEALPDTFDYASYGREEDRILKEQFGE